MLIFCKQAFASILFMNEIDKNLFEGCLDYQSLTDCDIHAAAWKDLEIMVLDRYQQRKRCALQN